MTTTPDRKRGRPIDEEARARRREEILQSATRVFAAHGYQHTELQAVAADAGIAKGTLYLYFESKEELFLAAVDQGLQQLSAFIDARIENISDPLLRIGQAIRGYLEFFQLHPEQVELWVQERAAFRDRQEPSYFRHRACNREVWHAMLRDLIAAGRFRDVPLSRIDDVLSELVFGTMFTNYFSARTKPLDEQAADILDIVYHGLFSDAERRRARRAN